MSERLIKDPKLHTVLEMAIDELFLNHPIVHWIAGTEFTKMNILSIHFMHNNLYMYTVCPLEVPKSPTFIRSVFSIQQFRPGGSPSHRPGAAGGMCKRRIGAEGEQWSCVRISEDETKNG